jgi:GTPase SAR1 family protein
VQTKLLLVGMPASGKTSLLRRLTGNGFSPLYDPTPSSDFIVFY